MSSITIRPLIEEDIDSLSELYKLFWNENQNVNKMKLKYDELKNDDRYIFLCAIIGNKVVGSIMGIICEELYGDCKPFLVMEDLIVHNEFRKMKIGSSLLNELEKIAKNKGCSQIVFLTESNRKGSISFYERLGYCSSTHKGFKRKLK